MRSDTPFHGWKGVFILETCLEVWAYKWVKTQPDTPLYTVNKNIKYYDYELTITTQADRIFDINFLILTSSVENLIPNPSESEGENGCDVLACFTTFSNILFDANYEFDSVENQSLSDVDIPKKIFSSPLFDEEIIDPHYFNVESDLIESLLNHDSSIIPSSSKIDSLLDEFAGELTLLKSIPSEID
nr:hypothetical protein [Tanacetum cinerariifolium]